MVQFDLVTALNVLWGALLGSGFSVGVAWHFFRKATADLKKMEDKILNETELSLQLIAVLGTAMLSMTITARGDDNADVI